MHAPGDAARLVRERLRDGALAQIAGAGGHVVIAAGLVGAQRVELAVADRGASVIVGSSGHARAPSVPARRSRSSVSAADGCSSAPRISTAGKGSRIVWTVIAGNQCADRAQAPWAQAAAAFPM